MSRLTPSRQAQTALVTAGAYRLGVKRKVAQLPHLGFTGRLPLRGRPYSTASEGHRTHRSDRRTELVPFQKIGYSTEQVPFYIPCAVTKKADGTRSVSATLCEPIRTGLRLVF